MGCGHPADVAAWTARQIRWRRPDLDWTGCLVIVHRIGDAGEWDENAAAVSPGETDSDAAELARLPDRPPDSPCWKCSGAPRARLAEPR